MVLYLSIVSKRLCCTSWGTDIAVKPVWGALGPPSLCVVPSPQPGTHANEGLEAISCRCGKLYPDGLGQGGDPSIAPARLGLASSSGVAAR